MMSSVRHTLSRATMGIILIMITLALWPSYLGALDHLPNTIEMKGITLVKNGVGIRRATIFGIRVYEAALYLPQPIREAQKLREFSEPWTMSMKFLREVSAEQLRDGWREGFEHNVPELQQVIPAVERFNALMVDVADGDEVWLRRHEDVVEVYKNDELLGEVEDDRFAADFLSVWFGPEPPHESLQLELLGLENEDAGA